MKDQQYRDLVSLASYKNSLSKLEKKGMKKPLTSNEIQEKYWLASKIEEEYAKPVKSVATCNCNPPFGQFDSDCEKHGIV